MQLKYFIGVFIILASQVQFVFAEERLQLTGKINQIKLSQNKNEVSVSLKATLTFTNIGKDPILFLKSDFPLYCITRELYGIRRNEATETRLWFQHTYPSIGVTPDWLNTKKTLDAGTPPTNLIERIESGESISFDVDDWAFFKSERDSFDDPEKLVWCEIKNAKSLSIRLGYRSWSQDFEPRSATKGEKPFGETLRNRWSKYGYLWLEDITSNPISLDLGLAVMNSVEN